MRSTGWPLVRPVLLRIRSESPWPTVEIRPTRAPVRETTALIPTVVPCERRLVWPSSSASESPIAVAAAAIFRQLTGGGVRARLSVHLQLDAQTGRAHIFERNAWNMEVDCLALNMLTAFGNPARSLAKCCVRFRRPVCAVDVDEAKLDIAMFDRVLLAPLIVLFVRVAVPESTYALDYPAQSILQLEME